MQKLKVVVAEEYDGEMKGSFLPGRVDEGTLAASVLVDKQLVLSFE